jgi:hypothetical protein
VTSIRDGEVKTIDQGTSRPETKVRTSSGTPDFVEIVWTFPVAADAGGLAHAHAAVSVARIRDGVSAG